MNYQWLAFKKFLCMFCSFFIPYKKIRHKVRYALNPLNDKRVEKYFRKQYVLPFLQKQNTIYPKREVTKDEKCEYIWQCWLQGIDEQTPMLIKMCLQSVEKYRKRNQKIVIITSKNYANYVCIPQLVIKKWEDGMISHTQFSDILRINLLSKYGGYWIDATCLLTSPIPEYIDKSASFMFRAYGEFSFTLIQSCFIHAQANNYLLQAWCTLMDNLWTKENKMLHYFQLHLMFKALVSTDPKAKKEFQRIPVVSEKETQSLMDFILEGPPYNIQEFKKIKEKSFMHKLTYKKEIPAEFESFYISNL